MKPKRNYNPYPILILHVLKEDNAAALNEVSEVKTTGNSNTTKANGVAARASIFEEMIAVRNREAAQKAEAKSKGKRK